MVEQSVCGDGPDAAKRVLVLQGGGALGSYQAGVFDALQRCGEQPDWVAGISIGAINAALIVGNPPARRVLALTEFWTLATAGVLAAPWIERGTGRAAFNEASAALIATFGVAGFFTPRVLGPLFYPPGLPEALSVYDTAPLKATLERLVDFDLINSRETRFSVGAVNIRTGNFAYFDNSRQRIGPEHVMASGALPPGFPPIEIDGEPYWDGGLVSNTPLDYVLEEQGEDDLLIFQVDLFSARGPMPRNLIDVAEREKDIRYSSRTRLNTDVNMKIRKAKAALCHLLKGLPPNMITEPHAALLAELAHQRAATVIQLVYRQKSYESSARDYEFSRQSMLDHWAAGVENVEHYLKNPGRMLDKLTDGEVAVFDPGWNPVPGPA